MSDEGAVFNADAVKRIKAAVKQVEAMPRDRTGNARQYGQRSARWLWVEIVEPAAGHGKYLGKIVLPPSDDITESGDVSETSVGESDEEGTEILIVNHTEAGEATWILTAGMKLPGTIRQENEDGKIVVVVASAAAGLQIRHGVLSVAGWSAGTNAVTLQPCVGPFDSTPLTDADDEELAPISCYVSYPLGSAAVSLAAASGDILGYVQIGVNVSDEPIFKLFNPPQMPRSTYKYECITNQSGADGTTNWKAGFVLAHNAPS